MSTHRAARQIVATENSGTASGVITYWALSGNVSYTKLQDAWDRAKMPEGDLLQPPSGLVALKRAIDCVAPEKCIIKPLKDQDGYTVIRKTVEVGAAQKWETDFSAYIANSGKLTVYVESSEGLGREREMRLAGQIEDLLDIELTQLHSTDLSTWFVWLVERRLRAVSLRDSGGFYFIPKGDTQEQWDRVATIIEQISAARILTIPAMHSQQATLAVLHALTEEIGAYTKNMTDALIEARMGKRALDTKISRCGDMLDKIGSYEELLGEQLTSLRESVDVLKAKYVEAWSVEAAKNDQ